MGDHPKPTRFSLRPPIAYHPRIICTPNQICSLIWTALAESSPGRQSWVNQDAGRSAFSVSNFARMIRCKAMVVRPCGLAAIVRNGASRFASSGESQPTTRRKKKETLMNRPYAAITAIHNCSLDRGYRLRSVVRSIAGDRCGEDRGRTARRSRIHHQGRDCARLALGAWRGIPSPSQRIERMDLSSGYSWIFAR